MIACIATPPFEAVPQYRRETFSGRTSFGFAQDFVPGAAVSKLPVCVKLAVLVGLLVTSATSHANEFNACMKANSASEKIELCSLVIHHSRRARQLERAYLRRGNAYAEVNRFADAVSDFTSLVRINPKVAGYYDNRQYALKSMGRLREALDDANVAIRLAPTYSFGYRSRGNVNDAMGHYDSAIADYTKAISIEPGDAGLLIDQGKILAKVGRDGEAIATFSHALNEALLHYVIALELLFGDRQAIQKNVAERAAVVTFLENRRSFKEQHDWIEAIYDLRSRYIHSGLEIKDEARIDQLRLLCEQVFRCLMRLQAVHATRESRRENALNAWRRELDYLAAALIAGKTPTSDQLSEAFIS